MFGLFQADLPIGNRLWLTLLAIIVGGSIAATPLAKAASDPISFGVNLLLLFGQATLIANLSLVFPLLAFEVVEYEIKRRADKNRAVFYLETEDYSPLFGRTIGFLSLVGYVIAVFWIANGHFSAGAGSLGLAIFLFAEVLFEWRDIYLSGYEYIELQHVRNINRARIFREEQIESYQLHEDWISLHAYLGDNSWDLLEFSKIFSLSRRKYRKGLIPERYVRVFPVALQKLLGRHVVRP